MIGGLMIVLDIYFFQVLKLLTGNLSPKARTTINITYWILSISVIALLLLLPYLNLDNVRRGLAEYCFFCFGRTFPPEAFCLYFFPDR
jgi:hypothetical protein